MAQNEVKHAGEPGRETGPVTAPRRAIYRDAILLQLFAIVFLADQLTKWLVIKFLDLGESVPVNGFFKLTHTFNTGSAFGLFSGQNFPLILVSVVGITILVLIYRSQHQPGNLLRLSLGLQFGGAAGNLLDRVRLGHVTDFVDVGSWPIFNVADASIVVGLGLLAWMFLISDGSKSSPKPDTAASDAAAGGGAARIPIMGGGSKIGISEGLDKNLKPGGGESSGEPPGVDLGEPNQGTRTPEPGDPSMGE